MHVLRRIVIGFLIFWLSLPLSLLTLPENTNNEFIEQSTVCVSLKTEKNQESGGFFSNVTMKVNSLPSIKTPLLMGQVIFEDVLNIEQLITRTLFYFWQSLIKPSRQILWQMTSHMQRSLMKKMGGAYPKNRLNLYFEYLPHKVETSFEQEIA